MRFATRLGLGLGWGAVHPGRLVQNAFRFMIGVRVNRVMKCQSNFSELYRCVGGT